MKAIRTEYFKTCSNEKEFALLRYYPYNGLGRS